MDFFLFFFFEETDMKIAYTGVFIESICVTVQ